MYNAMNPIAPRPYVANGQGYKKEDESDKTQDSLQQNNGRGQQGQQGQNQQQQNREQRTIASGRASDVAKQTPPPRRRNLKPRPTPNTGDSVSISNQQPQQPVSQPQMRPQQPAQMRPVQPQMMNTPQPMMRPVQQPMPQQIQQPQPMDKPAVQEPLQPQVYEAESPRPEADTRPMAATSNKVNIAQILKDFKNTITAIGTPDILREEVEDYLNQVEEHTKGEAPSINFVQTNLLNAAAILDRYISETLNKESKVVVKWLDALFLQRINYRYNDGEVNKAFLVKFPESEEEKRAKQEKAQKEAQQQAVEQPAVQEPVAEQPIQNQTVYEPLVQPQQSQFIQQPQQQEIIREYVQPQPVVQQPVVKPKKKPEVTIIPEDTELKSLFIQAKKHMFAHNPAKAMDIFHRALLRAQQINDGETQSKICLEMGKIYDDNNYVVQALNSYNRSLKSTTDNNLKTKAHYSMAQIYDEVNQIEPALNHYLTSVSYAGENDDLITQSTSLTKIANIFTDKLDEQAFDFYNEAVLLVSQTDDCKTKGFVSSNAAGAYTSFNKPDKALRYYADAVKNYTEVKAQENIAENYKAAAELMLDYKHPNKARVLLRKALKHADRINDIKLIGEINDLMEEIAC